MISRVRQWLDEQRSKRRRAVRRRKRNAKLRALPPEKKAALLKAKQNLLDAFHHGAREAHRNKK